MEVLCSGAFRLGGPERQRGRIYQTVVDTVFFVWFDEDCVDRVVLRHAAAGRPLAWCELV